MPIVNKDSPSDIAKSLLRRAKFGALATLAPGSGDPYCSLVNVAATAAGEPILLVSTLARHTQNIAADSRVSLMLHEPALAGDPLEAARIMLTGRAVACDDASAASARTRYLAAHPAAEQFADFADFGFFIIETANIHLVAGFGRIVDLAPGTVLTDLSGAEALLAAETDIVTHMNEDHADAIALYATKLLAAEHGEWTMTGVDPDGADLALADRRLRLPFPERITDAQAVRKALVSLVAKARSTA